MRTSLLFLLIIPLLTARAEAADLIIDGTTAQIVTPATYEIVRVINGGELTVAGMDFIHAATFVVDVSSTIKGQYFDWPIGGVDGQEGYGGSNGGRGSGSPLPYGSPGTSPAFDLENAHRRIDILYPGQRGGRGRDIIGGTCFPISCEIPNLPGAIGGLGGGCVGIDARYIEIQGIVDCNGQNAPSPIGSTCGGGIPQQAGGGGAGGSISLAAKHLIIGASSGLNANGGNGGNLSGYHGGGGGGRIKIYYESASIDSRALISARLGRPIGFYQDWAEDGTIFVRQLTNIQSLFASSADINNDGSVDAADFLLLASQWQDADPIPTSTLWPVPSYTPTRTRTPTRTPVGTLTPTPTPTPTWHPGLSTEDLTVDAVLVQLPAFTSKRHIHIGPQGTLQVNGTIWCATLEIDAGGTIVGDRLSGRGGGTPTTEKGGGGSYGGRGDQGGPVYGTKDGQNIQAGSCGANSYCQVPGGHRCYINYYTIAGFGGGALQVRASRIVINGTISMNGGAGSHFTCTSGNCCYPDPPGAGSGGGILLIGDEIIIGGSAIVRADGVTTSTPQNPSTRSGGGRIKMFYHKTADIAPSAVVSANGYEPGTIHIEKLAGE